MQGDDFGFIFEPLQELYLCDVSLCDSLIHTLEVDLLQCIDLAVFTEHSVHLHGWNIMLERGGREGGRGREG